MGLGHGAGVVRSGLAVYLDAANKKSYPGTGTVWTDLSDNGNNATLVNGVGYNSANNGSMIFDGVNDVVDTQNIQFERDDDFTLSAWIKSTNVNNNQVINNEDTTYKGYQLSISGTVFFGLRNTTTNRIQVETNNTLLANNWYHLAATYNGNSSASGVELYINAINQSKNILADNLTATTISNQTTWIGRRRPITNGPFNGSIGSVQLYNRALTQLEVQRNFNATRGRYGI